MNYNHKNQAALTYDENKKRLRLEGRILLDRVMNDVLHEMTEEFTAAILEGKILEIGASREEIQDYFRRSAQRQLEAGS